MPYITVVPAIRTIPGVEEFDYAINDGIDLLVGDLLFVPFRKRQVPALIIDRKPLSPFADRAIRLINPQPLFRLGEVTAKLVRQTAHRTFTSKPTILNAWIPQIPKRTNTVQITPLIADSSAGKALPQTRFLVNRWRDAAGLIPTAKSLKGKLLILTPWQHRADQLAKELAAPVTHADTAMVPTWEAISGFIQGKHSILVTTRIGAWLASQAGTVLIDEPENDDFKQDELSPRIDARWLVERCQDLRPELQIISFATTPRLTNHVPWSDIPNIDLDMTLEQWQWRSKSTIDALSQQTLTRITEALETNRPVTIIHQIRGERSRLACRDCGWGMTCAACNFSVSLVDGQALCKRCGKRSEAPLECPSCGGLDLSRGRSGKDRLTDQAAKQFDSPLIQVTDIAELQTKGIKRGSLVVITDVSLIGGVAEDIRRRERLIIAWRRLAASLASAEATTIVQGPEEITNECRRWLTADGVKNEWDRESKERNVFRYPPAIKMTKILVDGSDAEAETVRRDLEATIPANMSVRGPYPVPFRSKTRNKRFAVQLICPLEAPEEQLFSLLDPFKKRAIIDLDPIAFFG